MLNTMDITPVMTTIVARPELDTCSKAKFQLADELVGKINEGINQKTSHFRNKDGALLETLDQVIYAILDGTIKVDHRGKIIGLA